MCVCVRDRWKHRQILTTYKTKQQSHACGYETSDEQGGQDDVHYQHRALSRTPKVGGGGQPAEGVLRETLF